jgi:hypothetical protein
MAVDTHVPSKKFAFPHVSEDLVKATKKSKGKQFMPVYLVILHPI